MGLIYIIKNICNDKVYIGQTTKAMEHRFKEHIRASKNNYEPSMVLYKAMRKYGIENFYVELLENNLYGNNLLNEKEKYWIEQYNSLVPFGYNVRQGGEDCGRKEVYKIDIETNEIIEKYDSLAQASEDNNVDISHLSKVCQGKEKSCGGYKWCYVSDYNLNYIQSIIPKAHKRPIYQIDIITGEILDKFESIAEASRRTRTNAASISECLHGVNKTANEYNWCYVEMYDEDKFVTKSRCHQILQIDKETNSIIKQWISAKIAADTLGYNASTIRSACSGERKTAYGYKWKYL